MPERSKPPTDEFVFFGYPSRPEMSRESLANAAAAIQQSGVITAVTWEELDISGRLIIGRITEAIDRATATVFDVTFLNENVMFEVGYAIGADRRVWLVRQTSHVAAERAFSDFGVLRNVGYEAYENSHDLAASFHEKRPFARTSTFFQESIEPSLTLLQNRQSSTYAARSSLRPSEISAAASIGSAAQGSNALLQIHVSPPWSRSVGTHTTATWRRQSSYIYCTQAGAVARFTMHGAR